jgi:hypothetical protein
MKKKRAPVKTPFSALNQDVLLCTLEFVSFKNLLRYKTVCKDWKRIITFIMSQMLPITLYNNLRRRGQTNYSIKFENKWHFNKKREYYDEYYTDIKYDFFIVNVSLNFEFLVELNTKNISPKKFEKFRENHGFEKLTPNFTLSRDAILFDKENICNAASLLEDEYKDIPWDCVGESNESLPAGDWSILHKLLYIITDSNVSIVGTEELTVTTNAYNTVEVFVDMLYFFLMPDGRVFKVKLIGTADNSRYSSFCE